MQQFNLTVRWHIKTIVKSPAPLPFIHTDGKGTSSIHNIQIIFMFQHLGPSFLLSMIVN
jgi:hypothetical protein